MVDRKNKEKNINYHSWYLLETDELTDTPICRIRASQLSLARKTVRGWKKKVLEGD